MPTKQKKRQLPGIGMRMIKSAVAVLLCCFSYILLSFNGSSYVFYRQLTALWCIQPYSDGTKKNAIQRIVGTLIGAAVGLVTVVLLYNIFHVTNQWVEAIVIAVMIIPVLYISVVVHKKNASFFACTVFLGLVVMDMGDVSPMVFVFQRLADTVIGVIIGIVVNSFHLPRRRNFDTLYVAELEGTLLPKSGNLTDYAIFELKHMIADGIHFTISTPSTPAVIMEELKEISLPLPVIAMDGAVLYDTKEKKYVRSYVISYEKTQEIVTFLRNSGFQCFINTVVDDTLMIYHSELQNPAEKDMYKKMYSNPHRNYLSMELPEHTPCIYVMVIDDTEKIDTLYHSLIENGYTNHLKVMHYVSDDYPGYSYLKIYSRNAKKENMLEYLRKEIACNTLVTIGQSGDNFSYDYNISANTPDSAVHLLHQLFEPIGIPKRRKNNSHKKA